MDETGRVNRLFSILDVLGYLFGASDASRDPQRPPKGSFGGAFAVLLGFFGMSKNEVILVSPRFQPHLSMFLQRYFNLCASVFKGSAGFAKRIQYMMYNMYNI